MRRAWLLLALLLPAVASAAPTFKGWAAGAYVQGPEAGGDVTAPEITTRSIDTTGLELTLGIDESVSQGAGYADTDFTLTCSGGAATLTYASGDGTASHVYDISRAIASHETCTLAHDGSADSIEDAAGNDLAAFSGASVTNNSTVDVVAPTVSSAAINADGDELAVTFDEAVTQGAGYADGDWAATATDGALTFVYASGDTTDTHVLTPSRVIGSHEVVTLDWAGTANGLEDGAGNDLAAFEDEPVTNGSTVDTMAPTVTALRISATIFTMSFSEVVSNGAGYDDGDHTLTCSGGAVVPTYTSGSGSGVYYLTLDREVDADETCTYDWAGTANGIEDTAGNDLAAIVGEAVAVASADCASDATYDATRDATGDATGDKLCVGF